MQLFEAMEIWIMMMIVFVSEQMLMVRQVVMNVATSARAVLERFLDLEIVSHSLLFQPTPFVVDVLVLMLVLVLVCVLMVMHGGMRAFAAA